MRKSLALVVLALVCVAGLPVAAKAGGPTSVLVTQPGVAAGALYYDDEAYDALFSLLPAGETRGKPEAPGGGGADYNLTWMVHDVAPWRFDRVHIARDGTAWVSTTFSDDGASGWEQLKGGLELGRILRAVVGDGASPEQVSLSPEVAPETSAPASSDEGDTAWFSLAGWRWAVPGALLGVLLGAAASRRGRAEEPRQVLVSSVP